MWLFSSCTTILPRSQCATLDAYSRWGLVPQEISFIVMDIASPPLLRHCRLRAHQIPNPLNKVLRLGRMYMGVKSEVELITDRLPSYFFTSL